MNKAELINAVAEKAALSKKDSEAAVNAALEAITGALSDGEKVQLVGFGSFEVKKREARVGRNPKTKEAIEIPASKVPVFKAGKALKDVVAKYRRFCNRIFRGRGGMAAPTAFLQRRTICGWTSI